MYLVKPMALSDFICASMFEETETRSLIALPQLILAGRIAFINWEVNMLAPL
jgi:hypothetical protein